MPIMSVVLFAPSRIIYSAFIYNCFVFMNDFTHRNITPRSCCYFQIAEPWLMLRSFGKWQPHKLVASSFASTELHKLCHRHTGHYCLTYWVAQFEDWARLDSREKCLPSVSVWTWIIQWTSAWQYTIDTVSLFCFSFLSSGWLFSILDPHFHRMFTSYNVS